ncbi:hypothetical protein Pmani_011625 [Petrolisthes manimaculis]|uniref:Methyltransferase type 11 domain-containing protein n=1 Tax=Petrolisthes manimaculis TaxID=1843537 RepID=A0AAE1UE99_9EUCA|nr:hypothetical protein Pmani_011625 [Petrolisthes manimaculis]
MSLLPKTFHDFSSKQYWNTFFARRGDKAFEWYGEYAELCGMLHKYVRPQDNILVAGCGNSTLSADMYKVGYKSITNVDNSEVVIRRMEEQHLTSCPEMRWALMDLTNLDVGDEEFSCVLDKAALDAMFTDGSPEIVDTVNKYFAEVSRVLRVGGRFVCISLLQEHIVTHLLSWFSQHSWMIRVCRCEDAERSQSESGQFSFPVFVIVCTKFKQMPNLRTVLESQLDGDEVRRAENASQVVERVRELQQYALLRHTLHTKSLAGEDTAVELCDPSSGKTRYTIHLVDSLRKTHSLRFAVFIVPHGREREWLFGTQTGRERLAENAGARRLIVVHLQRDQTYPSLAGVQDELSARVMELAPTGLPSNTKVPFLSVGAELGEVHEIWRGESELSGGYVVEEVEAPGAPPLRRLVFLNNQNVIQSEARLVEAKEKKKRKKGGKEGREIEDGRRGRGKESSETEDGRRGKGKGRDGEGSREGGVAGGDSGGSDGGTRPVDFSHLSCQHHLAMVGGMALAPPAPSQPQTNTPTPHVLLLGLGGGLLATYIHKYFPKTKMIGVDLDPAMAQVAQQFFGLVPDHRLRVEICDGLDFIKKAADQGTKFDFIMFDVDSKDGSLGLSCPPAAFLEPCFLELVVACLTQPGVLIVNLVCRDQELRGRLMQEIKSVFPVVLSQGIPEEVNRVLFCSRALPRDPNKLKTRFEKGLTGLNGALKRRIKCSEDVIDVREVMENLTVL